MRRLREILLTLGAVLGAVCLLLGVVAVTAGVHVLVFRSGSMAPTIETGDLALTRTVAAAELRVDDVVSVIDAHGSRVTHRVANIAEQGAQRQLTMQGDANERPDVQIYTVSEAQRVSFVVPKAGYVVAWSTTPVGLVLLGGYGALLLSVLLRRKDREDDDPPAPAPRRRAPGKRQATRRRAPALLAVVLGGAMAVLPARAWAVPWPDPVTVGNIALTADTLQQVNSVTCTGGGLGASLTFVWPNKDVRYTYRVQVEKPAGTVVSTAVVANNGTVSAQQSYVLSLGLLGSLLGVSSTFTVRVRSELAATSWISPTGPSDTGTFTLGALTSC